MDAGKKHAALACNTDPGTVLQAAAAMHLLQGKSRILQTRLRPGGVIHRSPQLSFQDDFTPCSDTEIAYHGRCNQKSIGTLSHITDRAQLQFKFSFIDNIGVRQIEWPIGEGKWSPGQEADCRQHYPNQQVQFHLPAHWFARAFARPDRNTDQDRVRK